MCVCMCVCVCACVCVRMCVCAIGIYSEIVLHDISAISDINDISE